MKFEYSQKLTVNSTQEPWKREGLRVGLYGAPGSTKSYTAAAFLIEPFLEQGGTVVIFEPRAEWQTLKAKFPQVQVVGGPTNMDVPFSASHPKVYSDVVIEHGVSLVFYTADVEEEEKLISFVERFLGYLMKAEETTHRPVMVVLEEAHEYAPLSSRGHIAAPWVYARMVKRFKDVWTGGRKLNLIPVAITQRPQELHFGIRQLCNLSLYGQFSSQDIRYIDRECLEPYRKQGLKVESESLVDLKPGEFLVIHHKEASLELRSAKRLTPHGADTPTLEHIPEAPVEIKGAVSSLAQTLKDMLQRETTEGSELEKTKRQLKDAEVKLEEAERKLKLAKDMKELLSGANVPANVEKRIIELEGQLGDAQKQIVQLTHDRTEAQATVVGLQRSADLVKPFKDMIEGIIEEKLKAVPTATPSGSAAGIQMALAAVDHWLANPRVSKMEKRVLEILKAYPAGTWIPLSSFGYVIKGGSFQRSLRSLAKNNLIEIEGSSARLRA